MAQNNMLLLGGLALGALFLFKRGQASNLFSGLGIGGANSLTEPFTNAMPIDPVNGSFTPQPTLASGAFGGLSQTLSGGPSNSPLNIGKAIQNAAFKLASQIGSGGGTINLDPSVVSNISNMQSAILGAARANPGAVLKPGPNFKSPSINIPATPNFGNNFFQDE